MNKSAQTRTKMAVFMVIVAFSAVSMLWMFWRHPLGTTIVTSGVLLAFGVCARLARLIDADGRCELEHG